MGDICITMDDRFNDPRLNVSEHTAREHNNDGAIERQSAGKKPAAGEEYRKDIQVAEIIDPHVLSTRTLPCDC